MKIWSIIAAILGFPGKFVASRVPDMNDEAARLLAHMTNYVFWLTPTISLLIWLVIRHTLAQIHAG